MNGQSIPAQEPRGLAQKWRILISVMFGIFMIILDATIVNVAFPTLRREFGASLSQAQWVLSIYVLALGITTPVSGFLADRFHIKRVYVGGLAIFTAGSLLCGVAPSLGWLIVARGLQGFGGGLAQPLGPPQLYRAFPPEEQGAAFGFFGIALVVAPALGPILGGYLVDAGLWRAIFFVNIPIGIVAVILGRRFLLDFRTGRQPRFDPLGLMTAVLGFGSILYAATLAETVGWTGSGTLLFFAFGLAALTVFSIVELRVSKEPMLNLRLFANPIFLNAALIGYVATVALFGAEFMMPVYLQTFRGYTALETGLILLGIAIMAGIATPLAGRLYDRIGPRSILLVGFGVLCINTWQLSRITATTAIGFIVFLLALRGLAIGLTLQTSFVTALTSIHLDVLPRASSLLNSTRFVVQAVAVATMATILVSFISPELKAQQEKLQNNSTTTTSQAFGICSTPGIPPGENLPPGASAQLAALPAQQTQATEKTILSAMALVCKQSMDGFEAAYRITFYAAIGALILSAFLPGWPGKWGGRRSMQGAPPLVAD
jgi:EmrB/QacA subfamily drug resistance transporter